MRAQEQKKVLESLERSFEKGVGRHRGIGWVDVLAQLEGKLSALQSNASA